MRIEILAQPNENTADLENRLRALTLQMGISAQISRTSNFAAYSHLSIQPSQTPVVIINGHVEFAGRMPDADSLRKRLAEMRDRGSSLF